MKISKPGCLFGLIVTGLQTWLLCWAIWDHPHFWFVLGAMALLMFVNGIISNAEQATP